ncbi:hypothetical protein ASC89_12865 [Devosia sp. Root413D1]|uniref:ABC transporter ATP-binding protein n=1 Tax=Devosia sp. Root413D1 TaxID=1736531 RepID=UPI000701B87A|nr:sn-glycerol-3-phosphate ABC transporter ATP-binding protein UgpC [Devosia sp. Root413D1]KQW79185.1 hypothetical protein ASC89_12865 [Devosia sp. Root413D1]
MSAISIRSLHKTYGNVEVLKGIDLDVADGEFVVFVGRSGCGKSTLLRCIAGLETISDGSISIGGEEVTRRPPSKRGIAMVFQSYALYPHLTVRDNLGFSLNLARQPKAQIAQRVARVAGILRIEDLLDRRPAQLSGGQRQRVAIGRAIVREPEAFLFDEPLSNLDADLRVQMRHELMQLHEELSATMIYVTHDQVEAMTMADKIVVLNAGRIEQVGTPLELYSRPRNLFVATFIGSPRMNIVTASAARQAGLSVGAAAERIGIRPEHIAIGPAGSGQFNGTVGLTEHLGADSYYFVELDDGTRVNVRRSDNVMLSRGERVGLAPNPGYLHQFAADGARLD